MPDSKAESKPSVEKKKEEVKVEVEKEVYHQTEDGLPPRYIGGSLEPVNAKK